jgi:hypothetical protein
MTARMFVSSNGPKQNKSSDGAPKVRDAVHQVSLPHPRQRPLVYLGTLALARGLSSPRSCQLEHDECPPGARGALPTRVRSVCPFSI